MRRYAIQSLYNMRDLGGYPTKDGRFTEYGKILRSDCPTELHPADLKQLQKLNITQVIDLRTEGESQSRPSAYRTLPDVNYSLCTFVTGDLAPATEEDIPRGYLAMFEDFKNIKRVIELIAHHEGTTLFHCAVGKDRTGIVSALVLGLCQVPHEDILADYQISYTYLKPLIDELREKNPDWPTWMGRSNRSYMANALKLLLDKYGTFENYLATAGIGLESINCLKSKFVSNGE